MSRRIGAGRLAEALGPAALETDRLLRTLGLRRSAEANLKHYDTDARRLLDAYAAGVNAFVAGRPVLPLEFWIFSVKPQPWSPAGSRFASGKPLLANDPHLDLTAPSVWYLAHMHAPGLDVIGGTLPGVPGVLLGRTDRIAWGFTNTGPDVQDLYLEKLDRAGG